MLLEAVEVNWILKPDGRVVDQRLVEEGCFSNGVEGRLVRVQNDRRLMPASSGDQIQGRGCIRTEWGLRSWRAIKLPSAYSKGCRIS